MNVQANAAAFSGPGAALASRQELTRVIAVANQKGGVGKTDLTVNLSCQLASMGSRVLLIDLDPQANSTDYLVAPDAPQGMSTADLLLDDSVTFADVVMSDCRQNLDIAPSDQNLSSCQVRLANDINMQFKLKKKLKALTEGDSHYDFVMVDTPPSMGLLMVNTLTASSDVIVPVQTHYFAMDGVVRLQETIRKVREDINPSLRVLGAVLTMYDRRTLVSREVAERVRGEFDGRVFRTFIPSNVRLAEAPSHHKSIFEYDPKCAGAAAYRDLAKEVLACLGA